MSSNPSIPGGLCVVALTELEDTVALVIFQATLRDTPSINHWQVRRVCREIVRRLLAGGISETAIRNTLVHHRPSGEPDGSFSLGGLTLEPEKAIAAGILPPNFNQWVDEPQRGRDLEEIAADEQRQGCTIADDHMR